MWGYYNFMEVAGVNRNGVSLNRQTTTNTSGGLQQYRQTLKTAQTETANGMAKAKTGAPVSKNTGNGMPLTTTSTATTPRANVGADGTVKKVQKEPAWVAYTNKYGNTYGGSGGAFGRR